jgi:hypothetical protein
MRRISCRWSFLLAMLSSNYSHCSPIAPPKIPLESHEETYHDQLLFDEKNENLDPLSMPLRCYDELKQEIGIIKHQHLPHLHLL